MKKISIIVAIAENNAIGINPDYADAYYHRGLGFKEMGDYRQAHNDFEDYLSIEEEDEKMKNEVRLLIRKMGYRPQN